MTLPLDAPPPKVGKQDLGDYGKNKEIAIMMQDAATIAGVS